MRMATPPWTWQRKTATCPSGPVVQCLLKDGAAVDHTNNDGWTALHLAAYEGHLPVELLIKSGAIADHAANDGGWTALTASTQKGHLSIVRCLLQAGATVDHAANDGRTALYTSASKGHLSDVQCLVPHQGGRRGGPRQQHWQNRAEGRCAEGPPG